MTTVLLWWHRVYCDNTQFTVTRICFLWLPVDYCDSQFTVTHTQITVTPCLLWHTPSLLCNPVYSDDTQFTVMTPGLLWWHTVYCDNTQFNVSPTCFLWCPVYCETQFTLTTSSLLWCPVYCNTHPVFCDTVRSPMLGLCSSPGMSWPTPQRPERKPHLMQTARGFIIS